MFLARSSWRPIVKTLNLNVWALPLIFLHEYTLFVIDMHQNRSISTLLTPFDHFQKRVFGRLISWHHLRPCHMKWNTECILLHVYSIMHTKMRLKPRALLNIWAYKWLLADDIYLKKCPLSPLITFEVLPTLVGSHKDHFQPPRCHLCVKHKERWKVCREINLMSGTFPLQRLIEFTGMLSRASDSFNHIKRIFSSFSSHIPVCANA